MKDHEDNHKLASIAKLQYSIIIDVILTNKSDFFSASISTSGGATKFLTRLFDSPDRLW